MGNNETRPSRPNYLLGKFTKVSKSWISETMMLHIRSILDTFYGSGRSILCHLERSVLYNNNNLQLYSHKKLYPEIKYVQRHRSK